MYRSFGPGFRARISRLIIASQHTRTSSYSRRILSIQVHLTNMDHSKQSVRQASLSSSPNRRAPRVALPDEVNYSLVQDMGEGFRRQTARISALGTTFDMVYGEWVGAGTERSSKEVEASPVVLCLHGAPATDGAFRPIGSRIAAQGYRVLALNFPGNGYTKKDPEGRYDFSTPHKVELAKAFISALQLNRIAMVIGHSMGSHIVGNLAADPEMEGKIQSTCFLCGTGVTPHRMQKSSTVVPYLALLTYRFMYLPVIGWFFTYIFSTVVYRLGFRGKTRESQVLSIYEAYQMRFDVFGKDLARLAERQLPTLLFYSLNDKIVEPEVIPEAIEVLAIPKKDIKDYDDESNSDYVFEDAALRRVVRFTKGTHRLQFTNPKRTTEEILSLLDAVKNR